MKTKLSLLGLTVTAVLPSSWSAAFAQEADPASASEEISGPADSRCRRCVHASQLTAFPLATDVPVLQSQQTNFNSDIDACLALPGDILTQPLPKKSSKVTLPSTN